jgi:hypothetical protein
VPIAFIVPTHRNISHATSGRLSAIVRILRADSVEDGLRNRIVCDPAATRHPEDGPDRGHDENGETSE